MIFYSFFVRFWLHFGSLWASNLAPFSLQNRFKNRPGFRLRFGHDLSANLIKNRRFQNQSRPARSLIGLGFYESDLHFQLHVFTRFQSLVLNDFGSIVSQFCSRFGSISFHNAPSPKTHDRNPQNDVEMIKRSNDQTAIQDTFHKYGQAECAERLNPPPPTKEGAGRAEHVPRNARNGSQTVCAFRRRGAIYARITHKIASKIDFKFHIDF